MTWSITNAGSNAVSAGSVASFATTGITTVTGTLYILAILLDGVVSTPAPTISSISTAGGVTWTKISSVSTTTRGTLEIWYGMCTAGSAGVTWTVTPSANIRGYQYSTQAVTGNDTGLPVVQNATNTSTTSPIADTLSAFGSANNATLIAYGSTGGVSYCSATIKSGFTALYNTGFTATDLTTLAVSYLASPDTSPNYTFVNTPTTQVLAIAIELKALVISINSLMLMGCGL